LLLRSIEIEQNKLNSTRAFPMVYAHNDGRQAGIQKGEQIYMLSGSLALINGACHYLKPDAFDMAVDSYNEIMYVETRCTKIPHFLPATNMTQIIKMEPTIQLLYPANQPLHGSPSSSAAAIMVRFDLFVLSLIGIKYT
jgi:hypothetical protein